MLNGAKQWITNGTLADVAVVWAQTDDGIRGFLVEKGTPGLHLLRPARQVLAARLDHLRARLPRLPHPRATPCCPRPTGLKSPLMCLNQARYGIAWGGLGAAMECY